MNTPNAMQAMRRPMRDYAARHFRFTASEDGRVATVALNRPERKNPLTFDSYVELRDLFRELANGSDVRAIVLTGAGGNFSSGGDVFEIIEPLTRMAMPDLIALHSNDRRCRQGDAQMPAADHRRGRRNLRRRRGHTRHGFGLAPRDAGSEDRVFSSPGSGSPARTWAHAEFCRGLSDRAAPRSFCIPAGR